MDDKKLTEEQLKYASDFFQKQYIECIKTDTPTICKHLATAVIRYEVILKERKSNSKTT